MKSLTGMETGLGHPCLVTGKGTGKVHAGSSELAKQSISPVWRSVRDRCAGLSTKMLI